MLCEFLKFTSKFPLAHSRLSYFLALLANLSTCVPVVSVFLSTNLRALIVAMSLHDVCGEVDPACLRDHFQELPKNDSGGVLKLGTFDRGPRFFDFIV